MPGGLQLCYTDACARSTDAGVSRRTDQAIGAASGSAEAVLDIESVVDLLSGNG